MTEGCTRSFPTGAPRRWMSNLSSSNRLQPSLPRFASTSMNDIPPEMMAKDRPEDPYFADEELLYRRFRPEDLDGGEVAPEAFELPAMSVNREKSWSIFL